MATATVRIPVDKRDILRIIAGIEKTEMKETLYDLEETERPLPRLRPLTGELKGDYRVGVGGWRIRLTPDRESNVLHVCAILPRGEAH